MKLHDCLARLRQRLFAGLSQSRRRPVRRQAPARARVAPRLELLEDRLAPATVPAGFEIHAVASGGVFAGQHMSGLAVDPATGNLYVATDSPNFQRLAFNGAFNLYKVTPAGAVTQIGSYSYQHNELTDLTVGSNGNIYTVDASGEVFSINPNTGAQNLYSATGLYNLSRNQLFFDNSGNLILYTETSNNGTFVFQHVIPQVQGGGSQFLGYAPGADGDTAALEPNGNYIIFGDSNYPPVEVITAGHVAGTNYATRPMSSGGASSFEGGVVGYSLGSIDPVTGDIYSAIGNFGAGTARILFTPGNVGPTAPMTVFVDQIGNNHLDYSAFGVTNLRFGPRTDSLPGRSLFYLDTYTDTVYEVRGTAPTISGIGSPAITEGGSTFTVTVAGTNFDAGATVQWNGTPLTVTSRTGSTQIQATVPAALIAEEGSASITVTNPEMGATSAPFTVAIPDAPPVLTLPPNQTREATSALGAVVTFTGATATDYDDSPVTISYAPAQGSQFPFGMTTVTVTATNARGTTTTGAFTVTVLDTTPPSLSAVANQTLEATSPAGAVATYSATATDVVDGTDPVVSSIPSGSTFPFGTTTVYYSATDAHGNTASAHFTVTVRDTTPPVTTAPSSVSLTATYPAAVSVSLTATDSGSGVAATYYNVDGGSYATYAGAFAVSGTGTHTVSFYSTDVAGNQESPKSVSVIIKKATPSGTAGPDNITYGTALAGSQLGASLGGVAGTFSFGGLEGTKLSAGSYTETYTFTPTDTADYNSVSGSVAVNVALAPLTITADNKTKVYGAPLPTLTASYSGFVNGDTSAVVSGLTLSTIATTGSGVGSYPITASGASASNYSITYVAGSLTVTPAALTITATNFAKQYGGANPTLSASYSGFVNGDTSAVVSGVTLSTTATTGSGIGTYPITASGASAANYSISYVAGTLNVFPAPLTITADGKTKVYGSANPALTASYSGFVNGDTSTVVSGLTLSTTATTGSGVGTYSITASGATASNYSISYVAGSLTVTPATPTVSVSDAGGTYNGSAFPATSALVTGVAADGVIASFGDPSLSYTYYQNGAPLNGAPVGAGSYAVVAHYAGSANYKAADSAKVAAPGSAGDPLGLYGDVYGYRTKAGLVLEAGKSMAYVTAIDVVDLHYFDGPGGTNVVAAPPGSPYSYLLRNMNDGTYHDVTLGVAEGSPFTIKQASLTITADSKTKVYGAALPTLTASYSGFVNGDNAASLSTAPSLSTSASAASHVGSYSISASGAASSNYTISYVAGTLTVTPAALTITADSKSMTYGGTLPALTVSYTRLVNGDTPSSLTTPPTLATVPATSHAGSYTITASGAVDPDYTISYANGTLTINPAALTISADNKSMTYGGTLPTLTYTATGLVNGDTKASLTTQPTLSSVPATSHAGSYPITASGAVDPDYTISYVGGTLTINPAALTITANNKSMVFGGPLPTLTVTYTGLVNGDTPATFSTAPNTAPTVSTTATASSHVAGNPYGITVSGATDTDYSISYVGGTLTVTPAPLTITADNKTKVYGAALPTLTASYSGFVNGDTSANLTTQPTLNTTATASSHVAGSPYSITASGAADTDYSISYVAGSLTVTPVALTITADSKTKVYGAPLPALTASYSGFVNGDSSANLTTLPTLSIAATAASHVVTGGYPITASGAVDADYSISYMPGTLTVTPVALTITADSKTKAYGAALPALTVTYNGLVNGDTPTTFNSAPNTAPTISTTATAASHVAGNPYSITASGAVDNDYNISYVGGTLTVTPVALTITADNKTKAYGAALPALTASYSGFVNGDTSASLTTQPTLTTTATAASHVAGSPYAITASGAVDSDYSISYVAGSLTVTPVALTITADSKTKVYGAPLPTLTVTYSGLVNGDTPATFSTAPNTAPTVSTTATASSHVAGSPYAITASGAVDTDYSIGYVAGTLTVTPAALTITADSKTKVYGAALPTLTASYSGFVNGDTSTNLATQPTLSTTATAASHVAGSPYAITASGAADTDYTISYVSGTLTVTPAALTITADSKSMIFGGPLPALTATYTGLVNGDTPAIFSSTPNTPPTISTTATTASSVGNYPVTAGGGVDTDYTISYVSGTLSVTPYVTTAAVSVTPSSVQYSDLVTFTATLSPSSINSQAPATSVTFSVGNVSVGTASLAGSGSLTATVPNFQVLLAPGTYTVTAHFNGVNSNFSVTDQTTTLTVTQEDAIATYTGDIFVTTPSATTYTTTVTLRATIQDMPASTGDPYMGDIRNATVTFVNRDTNTVIGTVGFGTATPIALVNPSDVTTGTVAFPWTVTIPSSGSGAITPTIGIVVGANGVGYYARNSSYDNSVITVALPVGTGFITGGGYLMMQSPAGRYAGDVGTNENFGFNVKHNNGGNLQGNFNSIIRQNGHVYQIKSNSITSLAVDANVYAGHPYPTAVFLSKANLNDITNPNNPVGIAGNLSLQVTMTDTGAPANDSIGITLWNGSALWVSSHWTGATTVEQTLSNGSGNGNLVVHQLQLLQGAPGSGQAGGATLSQEMLRPFIAEALALWQAAGVTPEELSAVKDVSFQVADLPAGNLGWTTAAGTIILDRSAAGYGWFIDPTPADDPAFTGNASSPARGHVDLLTVITHEIGHVLGFPDDHGDGVMAETLPVGVRRVPAPVGTPGRVIATTVTVPDQPALDPVVAAGQPAESPLSTDVVAALLTGQTRAVSFPLASAAAVQKFEPSLLPGWSPTLAAAGNDVIGSLETQEAPAISGKGSSTHLLDQVFAQEGSLLEDSLLSDLALARPGH